MGWLVAVGRGLAAALLAVAVATPVSAAGQPVQAPCPKAATPVVAMPARPTPPPDNPAHRAVGGADLATSAMVIPAGASVPPALSATSWLVADLDSGAVLGACGAHEYATPASVQKLLLAAALLARLDPQQVVTVTDADLQYEPYSSSAGLLSGGNYTVETLWLGLILASGNDAANVLARLGGGADGLEGGVREMNLAAQRLGAHQTHAVTPSGLDGEGQFTSAYDLALIARVCFADPAFVRYALTPQMMIPAQPHLQREGFQIANQNRLIDNYAGALGGKTGYTDLARHTYVGAAERDGRRLVVTLVGAESVPQQGWQQGAALLDWGFGLARDASVGQLVEPARAPAEESPAPPAHAIENALVNGGIGGTVPILALGTAIAGACLGLSAVLRRRRRPGR